jgi:hypothetical protein
LSEEQEIIAEQAKGLQVLVDLLREWMDNPTTAYAIGKDCKGDPCDCLYCRSMHGCNDYEPFPPAQTIQ